MRLRYCGTRDVVCNTINQRPSRFSYMLVVKAVKLIQRCPLFGRYRGKQTSGGHPISVEKDPHRTLPTDVIKPIQNPPARRSAPRT
jgi:hypothetical protein